MRKLSLIGFVMAVALLAFSNQHIRLASAQDDKMMKDKGMKGKMMHTMTVMLDGKQEVPGPGDTDGKGKAKLTMNHDKGELCWDISVSKIQAPTAAHIHMGAAGQAGEVKVPLEKGANGSWKSCKMVDKAAMDEIMANPANFYVNVHNAEFPNGAVRGQLGGSAMSMKK